jgi:N-acetylated-alpha-linked acidic dipeptidase
MPRSPFQFTNLADTVQTHAGDLQDLRKRRQDEIKERNRQLDDGVLAAARPSADSSRRDGRRRPSAFANLAATEGAKRYQRALDAAKSRFAGNKDVIVAVNAKLRHSEQQLIDAAGLPNREWYRHLIYAPGFYTGYGVKTIPGVRENIEQGHYREAEAEGVRAASALGRLTALVESAAADLERLK